MTRYRDEARARMVSAPPDVGFHGNRRRRWRHRVHHLGDCLDELQARGGDDSGLDALLLLAFRALLPLADPGWWHAHPMARLNAAARRRLRRFDKRRRQGARRRWADSTLGQLGLQACGAAAIYARHGDVAALDRCAGFLDRLDQALAGAGTSRWPERSAGPCVAVRRTHHGGSQPPPRRGCRKRPRGRRNDV